MDSKIVAMIERWVKEGSEDMGEDEAIENVLSGFQVLIRKAAQRAAREQENPGADVDTSEAIIQNNKAKVTQFRLMRNQFEELTTGLIV
jgi:hypothetical protein